MSALPHTIPSAAGGGAPSEPAATPAGIDPAFLSSLAHELRNPLAPLVNALYLLRAKLGNDTDTSWALDIVDRQVGDLRALLDDTSDIARLLRGRLPRPTERMAANEVAQGAVEAAGAVLGSRRQSVEVVPGDAAFMIAGDRARLVRALCALVLQAGRAAAQGDVLRLAVDGSDTRDVAFVVDGPAHGLAGTPPPAPASFEAGIGVALADAVARWHGGSLVQRTDADGRPRSELRVPRPS